MNIDNAAGDRINETLSLISRISEQFGISTLDRHIEACRQLLDSNRSIDVAVLGQFKAGKSSFINSLIGRQILPVGVIPVTTVITRISYGESDSADISFFDGSRLKSGLDRLGEFVSESFNPLNEKNVAMVDIGVPELATLPNIRIVDTPGLNSVFKYHMKTSENWLPEVGMALIAISAERPLSEQDIDLIEQTAKFTPRIVILMTKSDILSPGQLKEMTDFIGSTLAKETGRKYPIYPYSIKEALSENSLRIMNEVLLSLAANPAGESERILAHKVRSLALSCISYLDIALKSSVSADNERNSLKTKIFDEKLGLEVIRQDLSVVSRDCMRNTRPLIGRYLEGFASPLTEKTKDALASEMPLWKGNLWRLTTMYRSWLNKYLSEEIMNLSKSENRHFFGTHRKAHESFSRAANTFRMMLDDNIAEVLGIRMSKSSWEMEIIEPEQPDIKTVPVFDFSFELIWFLIPMIIFRKLFERHFMNEIPRSVTINLSRLAAQWEDLINKSIGNMRKQTLNYIETEIKTIEGLLSDTSTKTSEIETLMIQLKTVSAEL